MKDSGLTYIARNQWKRRKSGSNISQNRSCPVISASFASATEEKICNDAKICILKYYCITPPEYVIAVAYKNISHILSGQGGGKQKALAPLKLGFWWNRAAPIFFMSEREQKEKTWKNITEENLNEQTNNLFLMRTQKLMHSANSSKSYKSGQHSRDSAIIWPPTIVRSESFFRGRTRRYNGGYEWNV